jgi:hypothetical protein
MRLPATITAALLADPALRRDFDAICACGGRRTGSASEERAQALLRQLGEDATGRQANAVATPYEGWNLRSSSLELLENGSAHPLEAHALLRSAATPPAGIEAEVLPLGRGTEAEFLAAGEALRGRVALVRHEYMFAAGHIHRRMKYGWAREAGAAGFLIAGPLPTRAVAGSSGRGREEGIPAFGISPEAAARLTRQDGLARVRLSVDASDEDAVTHALLFDLGAGEQVVVLSAHLDGHDPAESAIDNASGCAAALAVARALAPHADAFGARLRLAFFSAEEWALSGSRAYLDDLPPGERATIRLNVNLDSVGGASRLTALCSEDPGLAAWVARTCAAEGLEIETFLPLMANSDHANFAAHGIPALRLVAGFDEPGSLVRHVLTAADTRDKVSTGELRMAALTAAALVWDALVNGPRGTGPRS